MTVGRQKGKVRGDRQADRRQRPKTDCRRGESMTNGVEATDLHRGYCSYVSIQLTLKYISCQVCFISMQRSSRCASIPLDISHIRVQVGVLSNQTSDDMQQSRLADKIQKRVKIKVKIIRILYLHVKVKFLISECHLKCPLGSSRTWSLMISHSTFIPFQPLNCPVQSSADCPQLLHICKPLFNAP